MDGDGHKEMGKPIDFCKLSPYKRQKYRDTWLSVPKQPPPMSPFTATTQPVRKTLFGNSIPAMKAKCSPHTEILAKAKFPLPPIHYVTKAEKEMQRELEEEMTKEELKWLKRKSFAAPPRLVKKAALLAKTTPRIEAMALPKLRRIVEIFKDPQKLKHTKRSRPSHFPLPEKSRLNKPKTQRVCGCAESIKQKYFTPEE